MTCLKYQGLSREAKQQAEKLREQLQASEAHAAKLKQENMALRSQLGEDLKNEPRSSSQPNGKLCLLCLCILLLATCANAKAEQCCWCFLACSREHAYKSFEMAHRAWSIRGQLLIDHSLVRKLG